MSQAALERLKTRFGAAVLATHSQHGDDTALVAAARSLEILRFLKEDPELRFDMLIDLSAFDTLGLGAKTVRVVSGGEGQPAQAPLAVSGRFHVVYHLRSLASGKRLRVKVAVDEGTDGENPTVDSVTTLWKGANWAEREVWDMYGIVFRGHPDLRRLLMYEEFVGHPLRKDYPKEKRQPLVRRDFT